MEGKRDDEAARGELDDAVVVQHEVAWSLLDEFGIAPSGAVISGDAHVRAAVEPAIFEAVKHGELATGESEERHAHHVVAAGVFHHGNWRAPSPALVIGMDAHEACGALIGIAVVELRVDEDDST